MALPPGFIQSCRNLVVESPVAESVKTLPAGLALMSWKTSTMFGLKVNSQLVRSSVSAFVMVLMSSAAMAGDEAYGTGEGDDGMISVDPIEIGDGIGDGGPDDIFVIDPICIECGGEGGDPGVDLGDETWVGDVTCPPEVPSV